MGVKVGSLLGRDLSVGSVNMLAKAQVLVIYYLNVSRPVDIFTRWC